MSRLELRARKDLLLETAGLGLALVACAVLYLCGTGGAANYDEGVYLASLDALRHGQNLGSDVFASQPPGFYLLLRLAAAITGNGLDALRAAFIASALVGLLAAYVIGRSLAGRIGGFTALAVCALAPPFPTLAGRIEADPPATTLALVAIALAFVASGRRERPALAFSSGAVFALAVSVKLLAVTALVPLVAIAVSRSLCRRSLIAALAGSGAVVAAFLVAYGGVLGDLWNQVVSFHLDSRDAGPGLGDNAHRVAHFLDLRTPFAWLAIASAVTALGLLVRGKRVGTHPLWLWALAAALFLVFQRPLLDHHLVLLAAAFALAAGTTLAASIRIASRQRARVACAFVVLFTSAGVVQESRRLERDSVPEAPQVALAAAAIREASTPDELVVTDLPIVAHEAGRRVPGELVDTSAVRFASGSLTGARVMETIRTEHVRVVLVGREFENVPGLESSLRKLFGAPKPIGSFRLYLR
jgi:4-amino-4-deoxy-L-arabinose transferase-like glycosyltransferase